MSRESRDTLLVAAVVGLGIWLTLRNANASGPTYTGAPVLYDLGYSSPGIYPDVTGSGAVDPIGTWPGWATAPYNGPAVWPGQPGSDAAAAIGSIGTILNFAA